MSKKQEFLLFDPAEEEITPDKIIFDFRRDNRFLSNYHLQNILVRGKLFPSSEHAYQAFKTHDSDWFKHIQSAESCKIAKQRGLNAPIRDDWEYVKYDIMMEVLSSKFSVPELATRLLKTGQAYLVEGNYWHDNTWGVCTMLDCPRCKGKMALNQLGEILMIIRRSLQLKGG